MWRWTASVTPSSSSLVCSLYTSSVSRRWRHPGMINNSHVSCRGHPCSPLLRFVLVKCNCKFGVVCLVLQQEIYKKDRKQRDEDTKNISYRGWRLFSRTTNTIASVIAHPKRSISALHARGLKSTSLRDLQGWHRHWGNMPRPLYKREKLPFAHLRIFDVCVTRMRPQVKLMRSFDWASWLA